MNVILIPAYEPDTQLITLTKQLKEVGFDIVVVNDGSGEAYENIFTAVSQFAHVLVHEKNRGKGAALKTGMLYIRDHMPQAENFITCDADGQHRVEDVLRVNKQLEDGHKFVLTMRRMKKDIPLRSAVGNAMSRVVYTLLTKRYLADNQSGLRGFHRSHIKWMVRVAKDNYDYEMNVLYYASKKSIYITTILIDAIYINNNQSSHFQPVKDTIRIYKSLFHLAIGSFAGFFATELCIALFSAFLGYQYLMVSLPVTAAISYLVNIFVSKYFIFRKVRCYDYLTLLIHQIIAYILYTLGCLVFSFACPQVPLWLGFNLVFLIFLPLRYWLHKYTTIAMRTQE